MSSQYKSQQTNLDNKIGKVVEKLEFSNDVKQAVKQETNNEVAKLKKEIGKDLNIEEKQELKKLQSKSNMSIAKILYEYQKLKKAQVKKLKQEANKAKLEAAKRAKRKLPPLEPVTKEEKKDKAFIEKMKKHFGDIEEKMKAIAEIDTKLLNTKNEDKINDAVKHLKQLKNIGIDLVIADYQHMAANERDVGKKSKMQKKIEALQLFKRKELPKVKGGNKQFNRIRRKILVRIINKIKTFMKNPKTTGQFANLKKFGAGQSGGFLGITTAALFASPVVIALFWIGLFVLSIIAIISQIFINYALLYWVACIFTIGMTCKDESGRVRFNPFHDGGSPTRRKKRSGNRRRKSRRIRKQRKNRTKRRKSRRNRRTRSRRNRR